MRKHRSIDLRKLERWEKWVCGEKINETVNKDTRTMPIYNLKKCKQLSRCVDKCYVMAGLDLDQEKTGGWI